MHLAFYKGMPSDRWHRISHRLTCWFTSSHYSHVELVINGMCYSASARDSGVRSKALDLGSGKWDVVRIPGMSDADESDALDWFAEHAGQPYDWAGALRFAVPILPQRSKQWFCSEAVSAALGLDNPHDMTPEDVYQFVLSVSAIQTPKVQS